jgi:FkbM family methyltransferase
MSDKGFSDFTPSFAKDLLYKGLSKLGYKLVKTSKKSAIRSPLIAARDLLNGGGNTPVIFDVGANVGQTTRISRELFPNATIHAFEPGSEAFRQLSAALQGQPGIFLHQTAVGAAPGTIDLHENDNNTMSSVLPLGKEGWGSIQQVRSVEMTTVDQVAAKHGIDRITILKSDTQGYDLEVMKGASALMAEERIDCVFYEIIFSELYSGMPRFDEAIRLLLDRGFVLAGIHDIHSKGGIAAWADALFIHRRCLR